MTESVQSARLMMEVGAEGGSLTLFANHESPPRYSARLEDQTLTYIDEGETIERQSDWSSWDDAIQALDCYPWRKLRPCLVDPEVRARIWALVLADSEGIRPNRLEQWQELCGVVTDSSRFRGCLLGGAVGDALGAPVEFMTRDAILRRFGAEGITSYAPAFGGLGRITDDTQMTLFTAEGLIRAWVHGKTGGIGGYPSIVSHAYLRWLLTQGERPARAVDETPETSGWLFQQGELHSRRAPGNTCLTALRAMNDLGEPARNDSKGCGGVMRMAPVGLFLWKPRLRGPYDEAFQLGTDLAALTHGHSTGSLTAGVLAVLVQALVEVCSLQDALAAAKGLLRLAPGHEETLSALESAERLASSELPPATAISRLGQGWVAEEALAISVYCALVAKNFEHGVILAVNHDGDSDSTGAITGNLLGALLGAGAIPARWLEPLELGATIEEIAQDLFEYRNRPVGDDAEVTTRVSKKYPGS